MERLCRMSAIVPRLCQQGGRAWFWLSSGGRSLELEVHHFSPWPIRGCETRGCFLAVAFVRHAGQGVAPRVERPHRR